MKTDAEYNHNLSDSLQRLAEAWENPELFADNTFETAASYAYSMQKRPFEYYVARVKKLGLQGHRILDAGSGTGTWSFALSHVFDEVEGIDYTQNRVELATWLADSFDVANVKFSQGDIQNLKFPDSSFDVVFCYSVIISSLPLDKVLEEFFRVLKPGGFIYVCLNGIGWSCYLRDERGKDGEKYAVMGREGLYNTFCQQKMKNVHQHVISDGKNTQKFVSVSFAFLNKLMNKTQSLIFSKENAFFGRYVLAAQYLTGRLYLKTWLRRLERNGQATPLREAIELIQTQCGKLYVSQLAQDLAALSLGADEPFSYRNAGRGYDPKEAKKISTNLGFVDFQWAYEGLIQGSADSYRCEPLYEGLFDGHLKVWEFITFKPQNNLGAKISPSWLLNQAHLVRKTFYLAPCRTPFITNVDKAQFPSHLVSEAANLAKIAGGNRFVHEIAQKIVADQGLENNQAKARALTKFVQDLMLPHPAMQPMCQNGSAVLDPATLLFLGMGRCGAASSLLVELLRGIEIDAELQQLKNHIVVTAWINSCKVVLDASLLKGGIFLLDDVGNLASLEYLIENAEAANYLPNMLGWYAKALSASDLWGRKIYGYINTVRNLKLYSSFLSPEIDEMLPIIEKFQVEYANGMLNLSWQANSQGDDNTDLFYVVTLGTQSRGWDYEKEQQDASVYYERPNDIVLQKHVNDHCLSLELALDAEVSIYCEVRPVLKKRPKVFCWPSEEICIEP